MMSKGSKNIRSFNNCGEDFERMRICIGEFVFNATALSVVVPFAEKVCLSFQFRCRIAPPRRLRRKKDKKEASKFEIHLPLAPDFP